MGRPKRVIKANTTYHSFTRCRNLENYFSNRYFKAVVSQVIIYALTRYKFELNAFIIMPNHLHLAITTVNNKDTISRIMQLIKSMIAKRMNKLLGIKGPFWNERFGSRFVYYFPALCSYFAYNPLRWGLVKHAREWEFGSYDVYRKKNGKCNIDITMHKHFLALGDTLEECFRKQLEIDEYFMCQ